MRIKTLGMVIIGILVFVSIAIINLAIFNLKTNNEADRVWENTYAQAEKRSDALRFLQQELGNEQELNKLRVGALITDPSRIEELKAGILNARVELQGAKNLQEDDLSTQNYTFILRLLDQYDVLINTSLQALSGETLINSPVLYSNFNNEDVIKALTYFDLLTQQHLIDFSQEKNNQLLSLTKTNSKETIIAALVILLSSLASIWVVYIRLMKPLSQLQDVMIDIAVGDYSVDVPSIAKNDEIGEMARSLEILRDDAAELENVKEEQLINERRLAEINKKNAEIESKRLIEAEKEKRQNEEQRSRELAVEVEKQTRELRKSEASIRGILDSALDAFISSDDKGIILNFNKSAEKMFGYSSAEVVGQHIHMLVPDEFRNEHIEIVSKSSHLVQPTNLSENRQIFGLHKNGSNFPVSINLTSLKNDGSHIFVAALRDRSGEVKKEQKLQRLGSLLDRSMREVYVLDAEDLSFQEVNSRAIDVLGYSTDKLKDKKYTDILQNPSKEKISKLLEPLLVGDKEEVIFEGTHTCADGSNYPVEVNFHYWTNEFPPVYLAVVQDMTTRLKVRQEILDARDAAESASKAKSFFLANMSHELRTPLNAVLGYSEMLKEIANENSHYDYADDLDKISIAAEHLLTLINDILDLSKITSGKAEIIRHKTDVLSLVNEAGTLISPLVHAGKNELIIDVPETMEPMYSDEVRIRQILINILSNASKFTNNGIITLKVQPYRQGQEDHIKFTISDTGIGIPEDKIDTIFDEFSQVKSEIETKAEGSGLGLSICRRLCRAMQGDISIRSELGEGTTVEVTLPTDIGENKVACSTDDNTNNDNVIVLNPESFDNNIGSIPQQKILVIVGNEETGGLMKACLEVEDFKVSIALNAEEGMSKIKSFNPDTVILDLDYPDIHGLETVKEINNLYNNSIRIIVCSEEERKLQDSVIDTDNYITKPIEKAKLIRAVKSRAIVTSGAV